MTPMGRLQFCVTGKRAYLSRQDAESGARRLFKQVGYLRAYQCTGCGFWHLTSRPYRPWQHLNPFNRKRGQNLDHRQV